MATSLQDSSGDATTQRKSTSGDERNDRHVENLDAGLQQAAYVGNGAAVVSLNEHRQYLLNRHGTFDLDPVPDMGDADPYNWANWKVCLFRSVAVLCVELC
jgi:hypothetical protein